MRLTLVSVAFLALVRSLAPGVHAVPAVPRDVSGLLGAPLGGIDSLVAGTSATVEEIVQQLVQQLQICPSAAAPLLLRAAPTSPAFSASLTIPSSKTTTNVGLTTGAVSSPSGMSLSTPQGTPKASSTSPSRMRRQLQTPLPVNPSAIARIPSSVLAGASGRQLPTPLPSINPTAVAGILSPLESIISSFLARASGKLASAASKPTSSRPSLAPSQT